MIAIALVPWRRWHAFDKNPNYSEERRLKSDRCRKTNFENQLNWVQGKLYVLLRPEPVNMLLRMRRATSF